MPEQIQTLISNLKGFGTKRLAIMAGIAAIVMAVIGVGILCFTFYGTLSRRKRIANADDN